MKEWNSFYKNKIVLVIARNEAISQLTQEIASFLAMTNYKKIQTETAPKISAHLQMYLNTLSKNKILQSVNKISGIKKTG